VEVIAGIFTDGITEGFKMSAPYGDVPCLSSDEPMDSQTELVRR
jgi:hypothetical protein